MPPAGLGEGLKHEPARGAAASRRAFVTMMVATQGYLDLPWASGWLECLPTLRASQRMPIKRISLSSTCMEWDKDGSPEGRCDQ